MIRAIRGAITVSANKSEEIIGATKKLLETMLNKNELLEADLISIFFTVTTDLDQAFPARAARECGITDTPLMCATEIPVEGGLPRCIRILIHCYSNQKKSDLHHVYLGDARSLRPDLVKDDQSDD